ncbi:hypothetical protein D3C72_1836570 [compost metagenome]
MNHGINTRRGRYRARQTQRQVRIQQGDVRQQGWRDDHVLLTLAGGDHRYRSDFRAGACGGGDQNQRQAPAIGLVDAINIGQGFFAARQQRCQLGRIQRTATPETDHAIGAALPRGVHCV